MTTKQIERTDNTLSPADLTVWRMIFEGEGLSEPQAYLGMKDRTPVVVLEDGQTLR